MEDISVFYCVLSASWVLNNLLSRNEATVVSLVAVSYIFILSFYITVYIIICNSFPESDYSVLIYLQIIHTTSDGNLAIAGYKISDR